MNFEQLEESVQYLISKGFDSPEIGIVLGTGLGKLADEIEEKKVVHYHNIPSFPLSTVEFHSGKLLYGTLKGKKVVVMQGRFHVYEGYSMQDVTYPIRVMHQLGISKLFISNASGAVNLEFQKGDLMLVEDHLNLQGNSPLAFKNVTKFGERFVDMSEPYDLQMCQTLKSIAKENKISLQCGTYAAMMGPQLETKAEYRMLKILGADAVGMSTVPEVIVANHLNLPVIAVSVITDIGDPDNLKPIDIEDIIRIASEAEPKLVMLFSTLIERL
jgi:purine-nucleoside phosphorylase